VPHGRTDPLLNDDIGLAEYIACARRDGSVTIDSPDGKLFLVAPDIRRDGVQLPFTEAGSLLALPLLRAAYSDRMAWVMSVLSGLAYLPFERDDESYEELAAALAQADLALTAVFDSPETGTRGYLAHRTDAYGVLVFRGTEKDRKDIVTNLNARFYETPSGKMHRGFSLAYESVRGQIEAAVQKLRERDPHCQLFVTGHSLGGALALSATCHLEKSHLIAACYTFGSPRVGAPEWSDGLKTPVYRVVNGADCIPTVPGGAVSEWLIGLLPEWPLIGWLKRRAEKGFVGFQHAGDLRFLADHEGRPWLKIGAAAGWFRFKYFVWGKLIGAVMQLAPGRLSALFADHGIAAYQQKLQSIARRRNAGSPE